MRLWQLLKAFVKTYDGQDLVEYALLAAFVAIAFCALFQDTADQIWQAVVLVWETAVKM